MYDRLEYEKHDVLPRSKRLEQRVVRVQANRTAFGCHLSPDLLVAEEGDLEFRTVETNGDDGLNYNGEEEDSRHHRLVDDVWPNTRVLGRKPLQPEGERLV